MGLNLTKEDASMSTKMPVLFIGHGSPLNIVLDNEYTRSLAQLGQSLPTPEAIMVISAHWLTGGGTFVTCVKEPRTIYDFYGFPAELYEMKYPSPGSPVEAGRVTKAVRKVPVKCDYDWGLDHASWAVLKHMYPKADIPVFEMSLDYTFNEWHPKPLQYHYDLASELSGLRERGVLIIGSGNIVHNLGIIDFMHIDAEVYDWAEDFDAQVRACLLGGDHKPLLNYLNMGKSSELAVPTLDHYLPMVYAIGMQEKGEPLTFVHEGMQYASVSMRSFRIG
jgi:4,5-DOPA dioxygenase extradiol